MPSPATSTESPLAAVLDRVQDLGYQVIDCAYTLKGSPLVHGRGAPRHEGESESEWEQRLAMYHVLAVLGRDLERIGETLMEPGENGERLVGTVGGG